MDDQTPGQFCPKLIDRVFKLIIFPYRSWKWISNSKKETAYGMRASPTSVLSIPFLTLCGSGLTILRSSKRSKGASEVEKKKRKRITEEKASTTVPVKASKRKTKSACGWGICLDKVSETVSPGFMIEENLQQIFMNMGERKSKSILVETSTPAQELLEKRSQLAALPAPSSTAASIDNQTLAGGPKHPSN